MSGDASAIGLRLHPLGLDDEEVARAAHDEFAAEGLVLWPLLRPEVPWSEYLVTLEANRRPDQLSDGRVPGTVLAAEAEGTIVGRSSIRHSLNAFLEREGGHIGYAVRPAFRRRGYATAILAQSLMVARELGIVDVLITCDDDNVGSVKAIERCGGVLDSVVENDRGVAVRRYWIR